jgi:hypothetical protein
MVVTEVKRSIWLARVALKPGVFPWIYPLRVSQNLASEVHNVRDDALKDAISPCGGWWQMGRSMKSRSFQSKDDVAVACDISGTLRVDPNGTPFAENTMTQAERRTASEWIAAAVVVMTGGFWATHDEGRMQALHP